MTLYMITLFRVACQRIGPLRYWALVWFLCLFRLLANYRQLLKKGLEHLNGARVADRSWELAQLSVANAQLIFYGRFLATWSSL